MKIMEIKDLSFQGKVRVDKINILLRNSVAKNVEVVCDVSIGNLPVSYNGKVFNFVPDEELLDFLKTKIENAIKEDKISSSLAYLKSNKIE